MREEEGWSDEQDNLVAMTFRDSRDYPENLAKRIIFIYPLSADGNFPQRKHHPAFRRNAEARSWRKNAEIN